MGFSLIPKNDAYFADFDAAMKVVQEIVRTVRAAVDQEQLPKDLWRQVKAHEHRADALVRQVLDRLDNSFVTPIEREDIHLLIVTIDDVADSVCAAVSRLDIYEIETPTEDLRAIVRALDEMVDQLVVAVRCLRSLDPAAIREATGKADVLEEKIDDLFRDSLRRLFRRHPEAFDLLRWKDVYDILEGASDHGRHVARTVNHILVRHS